MGPGVDRSVFFLFSLFAALLVCLRGTAMADGINGFAELSYATSRAASTDATGQLTEQTGISYFQRYRLSFTDQLYPKLTLSASGTFEKAISLTETPDEDMRSTTVTVMPAVSLFFGDPFVTAGAGYNKREERTDPFGASAATQFFETKNAFLSLRPEGLPVLKLYFSRSDRYDKERETQDARTDTFTVNTQYSPVKNLDLSYGGTLLKNEDKLKDITSTTNTQTWRASYNDRLFNNRVSFYTDYSHARTTAETDSGHGALKLQLFPFAGLSAISAFNAAPPPPKLSGALSSTPTLINGDLTASTGINIGQSVSLGSDTRFREVGLDLVNALTVNTLDIYVVLNQVNQTLPTSVADRFTWYIYTSADGQTWTLYQSALPAVFDPFTNQFEITFPDVTTRFILAAVQPLSAAVIPPQGVDVSNIFITELQAFTAVTSTLRHSKFSNSSEAFDLNVRATITERPVFFYNMNYTHLKSDPGKTSFALTNSLTASAQLSRVVTGTAQVAREDDGDSSGMSAFSYNYNASLTATPLPTLRHNVTLNGRVTETDVLTTNSTAIYVTNSAQLFRGVDVTFGGGESRTSTSAGTTSDSMNMNFGASIVPNKAMSINVYYAESSVSSQAGSTQTSQSRTHSASASVSYRPVQTVYLFYQITETAATGQERQTTENYSASWSPFSSGTLQFSLAYFETIQSGAGEGFDRIKSASVSWRVAPRARLTAGYAITKSESSSLITDVKSFSTDLIMNF
jgi:hypothetical protein